MSYVTCHIFFLLFFGQTGEAYWWRVCCQRGLPRLVIRYLALKIFEKEKKKEKNTKNISLTNSKFTGQIIILVY